MNQLSMFPAFSLRLLAQVNLSSALVLGGGLSGTAREPQPAAPCSFYECCGHVSQGARRDALILNSQSIIKYRLADLTKAHQYVMAYIVDAQHSSFARRGSWQHPGP